MEIASLYLETAFSFNGSNITLNKLIEKAKEYEYSSLVLTDTKMHAVYQFYQKTQKEQLNCVIGVQLFLEPILSGDMIHVIAYAQNEEGYQNLLKLSSLQSFNKVLPFELTKKYLDSVSLLILCHDGEIYQSKASEASLKTLFHELKQLTKHLYLAENEHFDVNYTGNLNRVYVDYVRYFEHHDHAVFDSLKSIFQKPAEQDFTQIVDGTFKHKKAFDHLSKEQLKKLDQFIKNHTLTLKTKEAQLPIYKNEFNLSSKDYLEALAHKGLQKRLKDKSGSTDQYLLRLEKELTTIHEMGYDDYFLIVWDVIKYAKQKGILVGPGRGSAPGSLVAYSLGITDIDPLQFDLLFERFLNKARLTMPDIDIDFPDRVREDIIQYTKTRYGQEYVSYICTFGTFLKKSALRDTARIFNVEKKYIDEIVRKADKYESINTMIENDNDILNRMDYYPHLNEWLVVASNIEGLPKHVSTHAAGIILSHAPITEFTAIQEGLHGQYQTQYAQEDLESMGLLKMDFLGLRNLTMIEDILESIKRNEGKTVNVNHIPLNDQATFDLLKERSTTGIFQLESGGMRKLIKDMKINAFEDIVAILALFRPGPMQSIDTYLKRRFKKLPTTYLDEDLKNILSSTEGILLYQEQIMAIASKYAGYSMNEADLLRRAVSKKSDAILQAERERFVSKAMALGKDETLANKIYDYIVTFANYGFNKSHSVAYAMISYWMAYLKANYPAHFIAILMQSALQNESLMREYMQEALALGIEVKKPDVNLSREHFVFNEKTMYYPLIGIKNIGKSVVSGILEARDKPFSSFVDFVAKTQSVLNKRNYQYLIYAGACDSFGINKQTMIENLDAIQHFISYQGSIGTDEFQYNEKPEFEDVLIKRYEKDALGFNLSQNKLKAYMYLVEKYKVKRPSDLQNLPLDKSVYLLASVARIKEIKTKKNDMMAFLTLEDQLTQIDAVCFPNAYIEVKAFLDKYDVLLFEGKVKLKNSERQFTIEKAKKLELEKK
ncbi:DNA polymerase III subunit alpha [Liberiplasma polymorphum]|uniref:DNA polymerase III subunit alpha n=1 Tax=Liberiplasma polymorphum TaxID=3374570 RepID=UPI003771C2B6